MFISLKGPTKVIFLNFKFLNVGFDIPLDFFCISTDCKGNLYKIKLVPTTFLIYSTYLTYWTYSTYKISILKSMFISLKGPTKVSFKCLNLGSDIPLGSMHIFTDCKRNKNNFFCNLLNLFDLFNLQKVTLLRTKPA